eukprot:6019429-Amphidinium_carterae.1
MFHTSPVFATDALPKRHLFTARTMAFIACSHRVRKDFKVWIHCQVQAFVAAAPPFIKGNGLSI